ncbi:hypothetical protein FYJ84_04025 [Veillonellaceae bacterium WCA-693-APC-5D-A]|uniref:Uncharacterized protein n=1 Tax=Anaerovibrio slackiae TaxID=2652309 RepID=A0A6I2UEU7_9FIRM|nr:hypothetical protein [Anaerovibrio slackiae]MSU08160.1 hypothetical protein [Anaerovibrio slackiae]
MDNIRAKIFIEADEAGTKVEVNGAPSIIMFFLGQVIVDISKTSDVPLEDIREMLAKSIQVWSED